MAKMRKKGDLPVKTCVACGRPMVWRRAWAKVWDEVRYCSGACRSRKRAARQDITGGPPLPDPGGVLQKEDGAEDQLAPMKRANLPSV